MALLKNSIYGALLAMVLALALPGGARADIVVNPALGAGDITTCCNGFSDAGPGATIFVDGLTAIETVLSVTVGAGANLSLRVIDCCNSDPDLGNNDVFGITVNSVETAWTFSDSNGALDGDIGLFRAQLDLIGLAAGTYTFSFFVTLDVNNAEVGVMAWDVCSDAGCRWIPFVPPVTETPEPASLALFGLAVSGLVIARRRKTA